MGVAAQKYGLQGQEMPSKRARMPRSAQAYVPGSVAPAPRRGYERPDFVVVPNKRRIQETQVNVQLIMLMRVALTCLLIVGALAFVRVGVISATVQTSLATEKINSELKDRRSSSTTLEVQQTSLTNPSTVRMKAEALGMAAPVQVLNLDMDKDVVATNDAGELSLASSLAVAAQQAL